MSRGNLLQPNLALGDSILSLTPDILQEHNLKGLVLDVDETLVPLRVKAASDELRNWVEQIRPHVCLWLVSNNLSESRIRGIAESLNVPYMLGAAKPSRRKIRQAVEKMNLPVEEIAMVGDRVFTDVLAGNRLGMFTILVEPMIDPSNTARRYRWRSFEVWLSQIISSSLKSSNP